MRIAPLAAVILVSCSAPVAGENWVYVATQEDGSYFYFDKDSVNRKGDLVVVRERQDYSDKESDFAEGWTVVTYDCKARTYRHQARFARMNGSHTIDRYDDGADAIAYPAPSMSIAGVMLERLCDKAG